ncbi:MAG: hypothetical protein GC136_02790 [Alphaproteobacteria bacterium]|nr:hypothetical protein [Alphaproteobacteria bacterium]
MNIQTASETPIPPRFGALLKPLNYNIIPFDEAAPERDEPLVDALAMGFAGESFYGRDDGFNAPYYTRFADAYDTVYIRKGVAMRLLRVNESLAKAGLELYLLDGHRPISVQQNLWDHFTKVANEKMPDASAEEKLEYVSFHVSSPTRFDKNDFTTWPIHSTGGAIDLTLKRKNSNELLPMGGIFDESGPPAKACFYEDIAEGQRTDGDIAALKNRRILYHAMREAGFTNNYNEWWHFDYGTQRWANVKQIETGLPVKALYPTIELK